jgi:tRNA pseudouridine13 synthase
MSLPYLTPDSPGIGGVIKQRPEDFFVQELTLYEPTGQGEHIYCEVQKIGITTFEVINRLARALRVPPRDIGYAGMKDAQAITRQLFSIQGTTEDAVKNLQIPNLTVQWAARHGNKLRLGHLSGNRFAIKIREVQAEDVVKLKGVVDLIASRGLPNYFGEQRFGRRGNNHLLGAALLRDDNEGLLKLLLGSPDSKLDDAQSHGARKAYDRGDFAHAMRLYPRHCGMERRILARFVKTGKAWAAVKAVDEKLRRLWISALQSNLFNEVVAERIQSLDKLMDGDLAYKHENGACFHVESAAVEQPRCDAFEISPTGPLVGYRMTLPEGQPGQIEEKVFADHALTPAQFRAEGRLKVKGARRPLRVQPKDLELAGGADEFGPHITIAFTLPAGSFATVFLRELMKDE